MARMDRIMIQLLSLSNPAKLVCLTQQLSDLILEAGANAKGLVSGVLLDC